MEPIPVKEQDFLEEDPPIRNQNYVCLSFISPEDVLLEKETFYFSKFLDNFSNDMNELFKNLSLKFPDEKGVIEAIKDTHKYIGDYKDLDAQYKFFKSSNNDDIQKEFDKIQNFRTNIRGLKIRGTYDTVEEAKNQCQKLKKKDPNFDIYLGQVGCWIPFCPDPNSIQNQEYAETQLNTLMSKYKQNNENKDALFDERTKDAVKNNNKTGEDKNVVTASLEVADDDESYQPVFPDETTPPDGSQQTPTEVMEKLSLDEANK